jgi:DNA repair exonuclease SbcCD ATPase subunit
MFSFPILESISINNFSLYEKEGIIDLDFIDGVFCLAGANGLGKSTFLNLINYGLTGIVVDPSKDFTSIVSTSKFYNLNKKFAYKYFDGRVNEIDRGTSSIRLKFLIGEVNYEIQRSLFDSEELTLFTRKKNNVDTLTNDLSNSELFSAYCQYITEDIGLASFDQFVFLQHFVLSFDEHHYLLFWNNDLMETSLYLFFGVDPNEAKKANELRKDIKRFGSNIRNYVYHKNKLVKDVENLRANIVNNSDLKLPDGIQDEFEEIDSINTELDKSIVQLKNKLSQTNHRIAEKSYELSQKKAEYQSTFDNLFSENNDNSFLSDPKVITCLLDLKKEICEDKNTDEKFKIFYSLVKGGFCKGKVDKDKGFEELKIFDKEITELEENIKVEQTTKDRIETEIRNSNNELIKNSSRLFELEKEYGDILNKLSELAKSDYSGVLKVYENQIRVKTAEIEEIREEKANLEKEFKKIERVLNKGYDKAEEVFIPLFNKYAHNFLGLEVDLKLRNSSKGSTLVLIVEDTERSDFFQLSESQRYFIDIALRMALIEYSCNKATLLVDTPEGSLDIAYESRAGKMFGDFVDLGFNLVLTANINTSQLLIELASKCKSSKMQLERMTEWTHLSEVQYQEEEKIINAYKRIEEILN